MRHLSRLCAEGFHESLKEVIDPRNPTRSASKPAALVGCACSASLCPLGATGQPASIAYTKHAEEAAIGALRGLRADA
jgi:hypothetical protein